MPEEVTTKDKIKYTVSSAAGTGLLAGFMGFEGWSVAVGLVAGIAALHFSPELKRKFGRKATSFIEEMPAPHGVGLDWKSKVRWAITGDVQYPQGQEPVTEALPEQPSIEMLQEKQPEVQPGQIEATATEQKAIIGEDPERRLNLARNFQPDAQDLLSTGAVAFGIQGSGKTTVLARLFEQYCCKFGLPTLIFDTQGDFLSLCDCFPRAVLATPENMPTMADLLKRGLQVVVNLDEWQNDKHQMSFDLAGQQIANSIADLMALQRAIAPAKRVPVLVGLDECHLWLPQGSQPNYLKDETYGALKDALFALATTGRKLGTIPFLATQRISKVNKDLIGSIETRMFGKADLDVDLTRYKEYFAEEDASSKEVRLFDKGDMVICFMGQRLRVSMYNRETIHMSHTPRISQALRHYDEAAIHPKERDTGEFLPTVPATPRYGHRTSYDAYQRRKAVLRNVSREVASLTLARRGWQDDPVTEDLPEQKTELDKALEAYDSGSKTLDSLALAIGVSSWKARRVYTQVRSLRK